jgi:hypothetical protein
MATRRPRPEPQPVFVLTLRGEGPDVIHRLRRGLKFLWRACHLRAVDVREVHDRASPDDPARTGPP